MKPDAASPPTRWWVRFVHPLRWGFWLVSLPLLLVSAIASVLFGPWPMNVQFYHRFSTHLGIGWNHTYASSPPSSGASRVSGSVSLGPITIGHSRCSYGQYMRPGWLKFTNDRDQVTCWQYGWGNWTTNPNLAVDGIYVKWR